MLEVGSSESHLVKFTGIKKNTAFLCKGPFGTDLGLQGANEKGQCNWATAA